MTRQGLLHADWAHVAQVAPSIIPRPGALARALRRALRAVKSARAVLVTAIHLCAISFSIVPSCRGPAAGHNTCLTLRPALALNSESFKMQALLSHCGRSARSPAGALPCAHASARPCRSNAPSARRRVHARSGIDLPTFKLVGNTFQTAQGVRVRPVPRCAALPVRAWRGGASRTRAPIHAQPVPY